MQPEKENKKVNTSIAVSPTLLEQLRNYKKNNGVSTSWLVNTLLGNYLREKTYGKKESK